MQFVWDEAKNLANQRKHGLSFERAILAFHDPLRVTIMERIEGGEMRWQTFGIVDGTLLLMVAHTITDAEEIETIRVISARRATKSERWQYEHEAS
jgi:uncharacterized DUF497 family protein